MIAIHKQHIQIDQQRENDQPRLQTQTQHSSIHPQGKTQYPKAKREQQYRILKHRSPKNRIQKSNGQRCQIQKPNHAIDCSFLLLITQIRSITVSSSGNNFRSGQCFIKSQPFYLPLLNQLAQKYAQQPQMNWPQRIAKTIHEMLKQRFYCRDLQPTRTSHLQVMQENPYLMHIQRRTQ